MISSWVTAKALWAASSATATGSLGGLRAKANFFAEPFGGDTDYYLFTYATAGEITVPGGAMWSAGWSAVAQGTAEKAESVSPAVYAYIAAPVALTVAGVVHDLPGVEEGSWQQALAGEATTTGAVALKIESGPTSDVDRWDQFEAGAIDTSGFRRAVHRRTVSALSLRPTFHFT